MNSAEFTHRIEEEGVSLQLNSLHKRLFKSTREHVDYQQWVSSAPATSVAGLAKLKSLLETDEDSITGADHTLGMGMKIDYENNSVLIPHASCAEFNDMEAAGLSLPPSIPYTLFISRSGPLTSADTRLSIDWHDSSGRQVFPNRVGCVVSVGDHTYRLPHGIFQTVESVDRFNAEESIEVNIRLAHLAHLKDTVKGELDIVEFETRLSEIKLSHAQRFSLNVGVDRQDLRISPVLLTGDEHYPEPVLTSDEQVGFENAGFPAAPVAQASYLISDDHYLFVDPVLLPALNIVREVQTSNREVIKAFLRSPSGFIRRTLEDRGEWNGADEYALDLLFHETEAFSERVIGIGLWDHSSQGYEAANGEEWVPEEYVPLEVPSLDLDLGDEHSEEENENGPEEDGQANETDGPSRYLLTTESNLDSIEYEAKWNARGDAIQSVTIPNQLVSTLRPHQETGLHWLQSAWLAGFRGALLADDMGVGKTIQALGFMAWLQECSSNSKSDPMLIVAPVSLLVNWQNEITTHLNSDGLGHVALLYGTELRSYRTGLGKDIDAGSADLDLPRLKRCDVVLTTYETLRDYSISLGLLKYSCLIFDEMQKVKNPSSLMTLASKAMNADFSIGLTGTPVENSTADLWCILDTLIPGELGSRAEFQNQYGPDAPPANLRDLGRLLLEPNDGYPPMVLRRMKTDIAESLPKKMQLVRTLAMPELQLGCYEEALNMSVSDNPSIKLEMIHRLRSVSLHPSLDGSSSVRYENENQFVDQSARIKLVLRILDNLEPTGEKVLIFVESLAIQVQLMVLIERRYKLEHSVDRIFGGTPAKNRQVIVDRFSQRPDGVFDVLVLSPKAAGVGLNIVAANHVIHLSRWWNPAVEDQCTDRAYRIGQTKDVTVYLPLATHPKYPGCSFDETLHSMLERKRGVAAGVLVPGETGLEADQLVAELNQSR